MRRWLPITMIVVGIALMIISYLGLAAPWGNEAVSNSDPRMQFAPAVFILGIVLAFGSALVYEMLPDSSDD